MAEYLEYVTREGDRWDLIAHRMYGDAYDYERIIVANPDVPIVPVLPAGLTILVPLRPAEEIAAESLPPWKRP